MIRGKFDINLRRIRANRHIRELAAVVKLSHLDFIQPLFVDENLTRQTPITTLTGINSDTVDTVLRQIESDSKNGVTKFLLFPVPATKSDKDFNFDFAINAVKKIKSIFGDQVWIAADLCLCAFTSHGHCGLLNHDGTKVLNAETVDVLSTYAWQLAQAGADCIAPSDMMDGRVRGIRVKLDSSGFDHVAIMSYSAKFSSSWYGPFRDACKSAPGSDATLHDRKTYQLSPFNSHDGIRSALRDLEDGADILMVKPALLNADILSQLREIVHAPLAAYHVSGEYQGIELMAQQNIITRDKGHVEVWTSLKRAGADCLISYASRHARGWIEKIEY